MAGRAGDGEPSDAGTVSRVTHLIWHSRPGPAVTGSTRSVMIAGFSGWNDAADAASGAVDHLWRVWHAVRFATVDPEEFTDFTSNRPEVRVDAGVPGPLTWPETELGWCSPGGNLSVVLVRGPEPQLRWRTYCRTLLEAAEDLGCSTVVTLGAMLSEVPHTRPTPVFTTAHDPALIDALPLPSSQYEGPTGIPGVLHEAAHRGGFEAVALWAALPAYAAGVPSPQGALALVEQLASSAGVAVDIDDLVSASVEYVDQLGALVAEDEDTVVYLRQLEEAYDTEKVALGSTEDLVSEVEDFLRDQP